jgi:SM-20-related protein
VTPLAGTMLAFRRSERSFHGHRAHVGERRSLQLNWVTDSSVVRRELGRHRWSARLKALNPFAATSRATR